MNHQLIAGLVSQTVFLGSMYAAIGIGFVILYRSTGVVNFAQGILILLGSYVFYALFVQLQLSFWFACAGSIAATGLISSVFYFTMFYRLAGAELFAIVVATMGLSLVLQTIMQLIWGPDIRIIANVPGGSSALVSLLGVQFTLLEVVSITAVIATGLGLHFGLRKTLLGIRLRAVADSSLLAALNRVRVPTYSALAWGIAGLCSAIVGIALAGSSAVDPIDIPNVGLLVFPVVIIGGVDSLAGAMVGGFLVAAMQNITEQVLGGNWIYPVAYSVLLVVLLVRPRGLFGSREIVRI